MRKAAGPGSPGIVLILVSGILALLLTGALALLASARLAAFSAPAEGAAARLSATSGLEYASARLLRHGGRPDPPAPANRPDDWAWRDPLPTLLAGSQNPSYARGEPWTDDGRIPPGDLEDPLPGDRLFASGEAFVDLDGNGRRDAWSGRLRGGSSPFACRFLLRVASPDGLIPLNAGYLTPGNADGWDNDGDGIVDEPGEDRNDSSREDGYDNDDDGQVDEEDEGSPDHREPRLTHHVPLVRTLNALGRACGLGTIAAGTELIARRPVNGYRDWGEAARALAEAGCSPAQADAVRPFLDLEPDPTPAVGGPPGRYALAKPGLFAPIPSGRAVCLRVAPRKVLEAAWSGMTCSLPRGFLYGEADLAGKTSSIDGGSLFASITNPWIHPQEARALAEEAAPYLRRENASWEGLRQHLLDRAEAAFADDAADLAASPPTPVYRRSWLAAKATLAFFAVSPDLYPAQLSAALVWLDPLSTWAGWGLDADRAANGIQPPPAIGTVYAWDPFTNNPCAPIRFTLAPPFRFAISSLGRAGLGTSASLRTASGRVRTVSDRIEMGSQEDFERMWEIETLKRGGRTFLSSRGIRTLDTPSLWERKDCERDPATGAPTPRNPRIASLPCWDWRAGTGDAVLLADGIGFPTRPGALTMAGARGGRRSAQLYFPFSRDLDRAVGPEEQAETDPAYLPNPSSSSPGPIATPLVHSPPDEWSGNARNGPSSHPHSPHVLTPFFLSWQTGGIPVECPGLDRLTAVQDPGHAPPPPRDTSFSWAVRELSLEGWFTGRSVLHVNNRNTFAPPTRSILLETRRGWKGDPDTFGTFFRLAVRWPSARWRKVLGQWRATPEGPIVESEKEWFLQDPSTGPPSAYHVFLSMERRGTGRFLDPTNPADPGDPYISVFTLYVNGQEQLPHLEHWNQTAALPCDGSGGLFAGNELLGIEGVDDLRLYRLKTPPGGRPLPPDRFVQDATYTSPLYSLDEPTRPLEACWTGLIPPAWKEGGADPDAIRVTVTGYENADGTGSARSVGLGPYGSGKRFDLARLGAVRSFRYQVAFDGSGAPDPMLDAPVFESIRLALRRAGSSGWTAWSCD